MASHKELRVEWTMLDGDYNNWTLQDLQLAAELGRTLLERNEELENELKQQQAIIEDQAQEIEFLTKQSTSMKEQSENRAKFYEQLEQTIIELERTNTHLSRENEIDKKRIQSLCENIDYLERKCEEMSRALETIRDERAKRTLDGSRGKVNRGSYFNFGSDSSEEDNMTSGYGYFGFGFHRRRSHSLQDLRDYTPSPDEFDSGNSNSPDLKTSESEYVESLESRIEELMVAKKNETDKLHELESQIRLLIQENANLQTQLVQTNSEKDEQITELRRQLLDSGNYSQISFNASAITATSTRRNSANRGEGAPPNLEHEMNTSSLAILSPASPSCSSSSVTSSPNSPRPSSSSNLGDNEASSSSASTSSVSSRNKTHHNHVDLLTISNTRNNCNNGMFMCKRCNAEVSILSLVNSIEVEHDSDVNEANYPDFPYGVTGVSDQDMEFSSLEHELARATGASLPLDNRHNSKKISARSINRSFPLFPRHRTSIFHRDKVARANAISGAGNEIQLECDELEYDENFELFLGHQPNFDREVARACSSSSCSGGSSNKQGRRLFVMEESSDTGGCSSSSTHEDDDELDLDEEPCLAKDRKPEISRSKKNSGRNSSNKKCGNGNKPAKKSSGVGGNGGSGCELDEENSLVPLNPEHDEPLEELKVMFISKFHSKLLELPVRIPSDEEDELDDDDYEYDDVIDGIHAAKSSIPVVHPSDTAILFKDRLALEGSPSEDGKLICENNNDKKCQNGEPVRKTKCGIRGSSSSSGYESSDQEKGCTAEKVEGIAFPGKSILKVGEMMMLPSNENDMENLMDQKGEKDTDLERFEPSNVNDLEEPLYSCGENPEYEDYESYVETPEAKTRSTAPPSSSSIMPEYKQILQNLFSMFNNSKRKYPIPMYPYIKGQSSALITSQSISSNVTPTNNSNGCSSH